MPPTQNGVGPSGSQGASPAPQVHAKSCSRPSGTLRHWSACAGSHAWSHASHTESGSVRTQTPPQQRSLSSQCPFDWHPMQRSDSPGGPSAQIVRPRTHAALSPQRHSLRVQVSAVSASHPPSPHVAHCPPGAAFVAVQRPSQQSPSSPQSASTRHRHAPSTHSRSSPQAGPSPQTQRAGVPSPGSKQASAPAPQMTPQPPQS
jgi:hypothetical protein